MGLSRTITSELKATDAIVIPVGASKAALTAFTKALSEEFGYLGVRFNTVSPGPVRTDLWEAPGSFGSQVAAKLKTEHETFLGELAERFNVALERLADPEEVANLIAFLLSGHAVNHRGGLCNGRCNVKERLTPLVNDHLFSMEYGYAAPEDPARPRREE